MLASDVRRARRSLQSRRIWGKVLTNAVRRARPDAQPPRDLRPRTPALTQRSDRRRIHQNLRATDPLALRAVFLTQPSRAATV